MNLPRYAVAGGISLLIHGTVLFVAQEPKAFAMSAGQTSTAVSINFKAMAVPPKQEAVAHDLPKQQVQPEKIEPIQEIAPEPKPSKSITKAKSSVKKAVEKPKKVEAIAENKPAPKKPVSPKSVSPQKITPDIPKEKAQKPETKVSEVKPEPKVEPEKHTEVAESAQPANSGASSQPILVTKPTFVTRPTAPKYPRLAKRRGIQGVATYEVWLDEDGNQVKQALVSSSGALMLDEAALKAIKQWEFSPHIVNGRAMAHRVKIPVRFKLDR